MIGRGRMALLAAVVSALACTGIVLLSPSAPQAQTAADVQAAPSASPATTIPTSEVPFYDEWAGSPHALKSAEAFNHWNSDGQVPIPCARCHSTPGFRDYVGADGSAAGVLDHPAPIGTVITCVACHNSSTIDLTSVTFPSGARVDNLGANAICMTCHQGVESADSVIKATAGLPEDTVDPKLGFINVHYRAAGAMLVGTVARAAYQYPGKAYVGRSLHPEPYTGCTACHELHTVKVRVADCKACHTNVTNEASLHDIRIIKIDFAGDGSTTEGVARQVDYLRAQLLAAIQLYAKTVSGKPIVYDYDEFPYFFVDTNANGLADPDEKKPANKYNAWTPRLLKAAYNYQFVNKDPGAFAHNPTYAMQVLYDSISDLGARVKVDLAKAKRP